MECRKKPPSTEEERGATTGPELFRTDREGNLRPEVPHHTLLCHSPQTISLHTSAAHTAHPRRLCEEVLTVPLHTAQVTTARSPQDTAEDL